MSISKKIGIKCKKIKLILTDVDGVLTDGGRYYSNKGEIIKKFHVLDGMGVNLLLRNKIKTAVISKENSPIVKKWAKDMNITKVYSGVIRKEEKIKKICNDFKVKPDEIAYIGDGNNVARSLACGAYHMGMPFISSSPDEYKLTIDNETIKLLAV